MLLLQRFRDVRCGVPIVWCSGLCRLLLFVLPFWFDCLSPVMACQRISLVQRRRDTFVFPAGGRLHVSPRTFSYDASFIHSFSRGVFIWTQEKCLFLSSL